ncbi:Rrf2 family transcriptional regulator [Ruficoccus sp. ZRK36]|uniref:RrF2 family transcriptional regulator n=1 Tax=Ruficoccus sp. ZRK36 TaxID=2866311 RepID=UPI001C72FF51|nr:Rrf2 family transcriptional regulator [Ruficoccus sp. ZRK36]QYY35352.1 Rrf2 family transcriptional regulator [Ruficoccus sp. ZRK36]
MKISLKVEYACRVLAQLARSHGNQQLAHIEELAQAEDIPANYLVQILNELRNGGLITSRRGKQGGYALAQAPSEISLYDIIRIVDAEMLENSVSANGQSGQAVQGIWAEIGDTFAERTKNIPLSDMVAETGPMYYI